MTNLEEYRIDFKYLVISELDRMFGLWVNTVGYQAIARGKNYPSSDHPSSYYFHASKGRVLHEYQLLYITNGEGYFESDSTRKTKIEKGTILMLFPNQWHTYHPVKATGWNEYYVGFEGPIVDNLLFRSFFSPQNQVMHVGIHEDLVSLFNQAIQVAKDDKTGAQQYLAGIVYHMLGKTLSLQKNESLESFEAREKVEQAKVYMTERVYDDVNPEEIAHHLNISYSWFRKIFKEYTGHAPAQYFKELKINKAKQLLVETNLTMKEIAFKLNYNSTEHFFSIFKKKARLTPSEYRSFGKE